MKLSSTERKFYEFPNVKIIRIAIRADLMALSFLGHTENLEGWGISSKGETFDETDGTW